MAPRRTSIRSRAASIIRSPLATIHQGILHDPSSEKGDSAHHQLNEKQDGSDAYRTLSSSGHSQQSSGSVMAQDREAQRLVRSVPSWVHTREDVQDILIPGLPAFPAPEDAYVAQHNHAPSSTRKKSDRVLHSSGIHTDEEDGEEEEEWVPPWPGATMEDTNSRWRAYKSAVMYPHISPHGSQQVTPEWWREHGPDYDQPWLAGRDEVGSDEGTMMFKHGIRRRAWYQRLERTILRSPIVPMVIRLTVLSFSVIALGLATSIHRLSDDFPALARSPSTDMAIIVDAIAIVYLLYITYDEYSGKPLGLRSARAKMRLIFLDLFFIVFDSANLSLAFVSIRNTTCEVEKGFQLDEQCDPTLAHAFDKILMRQRTLASVPLIALIAWLLTFSISITRLMEKITHR